MKLLAPHYILLALTAIAAGLAGVAASPAFAAQSGTLLTIAGLLTGIASMLGVTSHSAVNPALSPPPPTPGYGAPPVVPPFQGRNP